MVGEGKQPLTGVSVLDASHVIAGPYTTYQLALLGAEVIRVERIDGNDFVRRHGGTDEMKANGLGASFLSQNACKKSISLNLKHPRGVELFHRLARKADVVMENFRPGVVERLRISFTDIAAVNPRVIYCSLSGYGATGPLANAPAYDHIVQGLSGMMAMTGTPESGPMRVGFPIVDYIAGQTAALAILAALAQRDRHGAEPQHLNVPMLDSLVSMMGAYAVDFQSTGNLRGLQGNEAFSNSPFSGRFDTASGHIVVTANTPDQAHRLCDVIDRSDLAAGLDAAAARGEFNAEQLVAIREALKAAFAAASAEEWEHRLTLADVPAAAVRTLAEILEHPQLRQSGLMQELVVPETGTTVNVPGLPVQTDSWPARALTAAPTLGRDTDLVLGRAGYSPSEIAELRAERVIA